MTLEQEGALTGQAESAESELGVLAKKPDDLLNPATARAQIEAYLDQFREANGALRSTDDKRNKRPKVSTFN